MYSITVTANNNAFPETFVFPLENPFDAWYILDGQTARCGDAKLFINADREVYAVYTAPDGTEHYGTLGDADNEVLGDNYGIENGEHYFFYENPRTKEYYV